MEDFYKTIMDALRAGVEKYGSARRLAEAASMNPSTLTKWLAKDGGRSPNLRELAPLMDLLGISAAPQTPSREVCFVDAKCSPTADGHLPPRPENYLAVPLVDEVGAGPGIIPQDQLLSWFLVYRDQIAVRDRGRLIAVQIGRTSTSMVPTLHPGDIVLVNLEDKQVDKPGRIMLVMDPMDGSGMIKRVAVEPRKGDYRITFYSDNAVQNPPLVYSWLEDFGRDWDRAIAGHVVWAWSDISNK